MGNYLFHLSNDYGENLCRVLVLYHNFMIKAMMAGSYSALEENKAKNK